jgi:hypothetical protein
MSVSSDMEPGEWNARFISVDDSAGYSGIYSGEGVSGLSFEVYGTSGTGKGPEFDPSSFSVTPKRATAGDTVTFSAKASAGSAKLNDSMQLHFVMPISKQDRTVWLYDKDGDGTYVGTMSVSSDMEPGEWNARFISVDDSAGYSGIYSGEGVSGLSFEVTKDTISDRRTIRYKDGMDGQAFEDVTYSCSDGDATPPFSGTFKDGYWTITGWSPDVAKTVDGDAVYTAKLEGHPDYSAYVDEGEIALSYKEDGNSTSFASWTVDDSSIGHITGSTIGLYTPSGIEYSSTFQPEKVGHTKVSLQVWGRGTIATFYVEVLPSRKIDISNGSIEGIPESIIYTPNSNAVSPKISVGGKTLQEGTDYALEFTGTDDTGTATVKATGKGMYKGDLSTTYQILPRPLSDVSLDKIPDQAYAGAAIEPTPSLSYNSTTLVAGTDYVASYHDNEAIGTASVSLTGAGNYSGTVATSFVIYGDMTQATVERIPDQLYSGNPITPSVVVKLFDLSLQDTSDYGVSYSNNIEAGTATVTITGNGSAYRGFATKTFRIVTPVSMYRLYNRWSGEHLFTASADEYAFLASIGWTQEGIAWKSPSASDTPVYRLYNPYSGDHFYTSDKTEYDYLGSIGWNQEGISFYSADTTTGIPIYRLFNKWLTQGTHLFTTSADEYRQLGSIGWNQEGIAFYGLDA